MQPSSNVLKADEATTERAKVLLPFGFTERQARFLATVMLHSGVFVGRQYAAFADVTHGQKVHDFAENLLVRRFVTPIELGSTGRTRICHVHQASFHDFDEFERLVEVARSEALAFLVVMLGGEAGLRCGR
jgi:hypothetical protein